MSVPLTVATSRCRLIITCVAATALASTASGCGSSRHATGRVAWVDRPVARYVIPAPKLVPYPTSAPACRASQLRVSQGRGGAAAGTAYEQLVFTNLGHGACLLRGYPTIAAIDPGGRRVRLRPRHAGLTFFELTPADIEPSGHSFLGLATGDACNGGTRKATIYRQLRVTVGSGETVHAVPAVSIREVCGLFLSSFGRPARYTPLAPAPGTPGTLRASARLARTVRAGRVLIYTITLSNPTSTDVALKHCPSYNEGIYAAGHVMRRWLALNCDRVRTIPAHTHVRYAMELAIPAATSAGIAKFGWSLDTPNGPSVGRIIRVIQAH
jgi:hypothetical protein